MKRCKYCKEKFTPRFSSLQPTCEKPSCILQHKKTVDEKKSKAEIKKMKEGLLTHSDYENLLQQCVNKIVRLIDFGQPCISCNRPVSTEGYSMSGKPQASHRFSVGSNNSLRFNLMINFLSCYRCNVRLSGNPDGYDEGLKNVFGNDIYEEVHYQKQLYPSVKKSIPELKVCLSRAKDIIKELEKDKKVRTPRERVELRHKFNKQIGIYI